MKGLDTLLSQEEEGEQELRDRATFLPETFIDTIIPSQNTGFRNCSSHTLVPNYRFLVRHWDSRPSETVWADEMARSTHGSGSNSCSYCCATTWWSASFTPVSAALIAPLKEVLSLDESLGWLIWSAETVFFAAKQGSSCILLEGNHSLVALVLAFIISQMLRWLVHNCSLSYGSCSFLVPESMRHCPCLTWKPPTDGATRETDV